MKKPENARYKILEKLGEGGVGEVYLAEDTVLGRKVALKKLSSGRISDPDSRRRFIQEAKAQALLNHPNIATFFEVGETPEEVFIVMEYVEGRVLSQLVTDGKLSLSDTLDLAIQIGGGLSAAHEAGIVHR
ncbi:MAG TPA: serine/threonine-protein kinase, partial [candidate division Zixibacteria bacterium]|nr:serine/threonine-protein kinase [candidate division Zixibacteria bacterium]